MKTAKVKTRACTRLILGIVLTLFSVQSYAVERKVFYHNNLLGSPVAATDESGNLCWREDYRPYGEKIRNEDQGCGLDDNVVGYTGHVHDGDIGLTYMQARYYDPVVGRFMGVDPVGFRPSNTTLFNKYAYANNNPYKFKDPNGRLAFAIPAIVAAFEFLAAQFTTVTVVATTVTAVAAVNKLDEMVGIPSAADVMQNEEDKEKNRASNTKNPHGAFDSITKQQDKAVTGRPKIKDDAEWEGAKSRPKQNEIQSTEKSRQRDKHALDRLDIDDLDDMDDLGDIDDEGDDTQNEQQDTDTDGTT